jgi:hypothetical protein
MANKGGQVLACWQWAAWVVVGRHLFLGLTLYANHGLEDPITRCTLLKPQRAPLSAITISAPKAQLSSARYIRTAFSSSVSFCVRIYRPRDPSSEAFVRIHSDSAMDPTVAASIRDSIDLQRPIYAEKKCRRESRHKVKEWFLAKWYSVLQRY